MLSKKLVGSYEILLGSGDLTGKRALLDKSKEEDKAKEEHV